MGAAGPLKPLVVPLSFCPPNECGQLRATLASLVDPHRAYRIERSSTAPRKCCRESIGIPALPLVGPALLYCFDHSVFGSRSRILANPRCVQIRVPERHAEM